MLDCGENRDSCLYKGKDSEFGVQIIEVSVGEINVSKIKASRKYNGNMTDWTESNSICNHTDDREAGARFVNQATIIQKPVDANFSEKCRFLSAGFYCIRYWMFNFISLQPNYILCCSSNKQ